MLFVWKKIIIYNRTQLLYKIRAFYNLDLNSHQIFNSEVMEWFELGIRLLLFVYWFDKVTGVKSLTEETYTNRRSSFTLQLYSFRTPKWCAQLELMIVCAYREKAHLPAAWYQVLLLNDDKEDRQIHNTRDDWILLGRIHITRNDTSLSPMLTWKNFAGTATW